MSQVTISRVDSTSALKRFIRLPWQIYTDDKNWVPPLIMDMKKILSPKQNPFFQHSAADLFLASKNGKVVGRIAAILNNNHNKFHQEHVGFWGFFEATDDEAVAAALFREAETWAKNRHLEALRGPVNPTTNDTCGLLTEGFDVPPVVMMPYNPPYYENLVQNCGYGKVQDLLAYKMTQEVGLNPRIHKIAAIARNQEGLTLRPINMKDFWGDVDKIKKIYNDAWSNNWGFVPMTDAEFIHLAKDLKPVVDPDLALLVELDGEPIAFSLALPDFNQALHKINGRLLPFGIFKVLYFSKKICGIRVITLGVVKKHQSSRGLGPLLYEETFNRGIAKGHTWGEFSWILESNNPMNSALQILGAQVYKKYRIYEKSLL